MKIIDMNLKQSKKTSPLKVFSAVGRTQDKQGLDSSNSINSVFSFPCFQCLN